MVRKAEVRMWMRKHLDEFQDPRTGEYNVTELAERAADALGIGAVDGYLPEWVDDLAVDVALAAEARA